MNNTPMRSQTTPETRPCAVLHPDLAEMNVSSVGGAEYFVNFIQDVFGHVSACHMKTKCQVTELLKQLVRWVERQMDCRVKKIATHGGKEYITGTKELKVDEI